MSPPVVIYSSFDSDGGSFQASCWWPSIASLSGSGEGRRERKDCTGHRSEACKGRSWHPCVDGEGGCIAFRVATSVLWLRELDKNATQRSITLGPRSGVPTPYHDAIDPN